MEQLLVTIAEAARLASISRAQAYLFINAGIWQVVRLPGTRSVRVSVAFLEEWIRKNTTGGTPAKI